MTAYLPAESCELSIPESTLRVRREGVRREYHLVELTSRRMKGSFPRHKLPQLFFSQTKTLVLGWYDWGNFKRMERSSLDDLMSKYGVPVDTLRKVQHILKKVIKFVRAHAEGEQFALVYDPSQSGVLQLFTKEAGGMVAASDSLREELKATATDAANSEAEKGKEK